MGWFRYGVIEQALAEVFRVTPDQMGALRGRLRHLRNINCPKLPKTGSGQPVLITREQAIEILIAIELGRLGVAPRHAVEAAKFFAEEISDPRRDTVGCDDRLIVSPRKDFRGPSDPPLSALHLSDNNPQRLLYTDDDAVTSLQQATPSLVERLLTGGTFAVVNIAKSVALLDAALRRATAGTRFQLEESETISPSQQKAGSRSRTGGTSISADEKRQSRGADYRPAPETNKRQSRARRP
jgi:hypothetical protein